MSELDKQPKKSGKGLWILAAIIAIVALPEIIAVTLHVIKWRPQSTTNKGELVVPARLIPDLALTAHDGRQVKFSEFHGKWSIIYFGGSACDEVCQKNIYTIRQVHAALGKEQERIQRILVLAGNKAVESIKDKLKDYPGMTVISGPEAGVVELSKQFALEGNKSADSRRIYLVDPMGNLFMSYDDTHDPNGIRKDLVHLLKNSWVG